MKTKDYIKKDGSKGQIFMFEAGDEVIPLYDRPFKNNANDKRKFDEYTIKVKNGDSEVYVKLTKTQYNQLMEHEPLTNKIIKAEEYENQYGTFIGLRVINK
jgi:hypothetical protein